MNRGKKKFTFELDSFTAMALAQWLKRYTWTSIRTSAINDEEARWIRTGLDTVRRELNENGFDPR